jgi:mannosyltransferase
MEAASLPRERPGSAFQSVAEAARERPRTFWILAGLMVLAAVLRFATLGTQAYHHDEIVTASRVLRAGFGHAMDAVWFSESAPPLYYALAWVWTQVTGTGEWGLRSISALAGVAVVPVAYLIGAELRDRRAGLMSAALVAVNPMLLWYSQEARGYSLMILFCSVSLLYFVRALRSGRRRDVVWWGASSALALGTHYFALFALLPEAVLLLLRRTRACLPGLGILLLAGVALSPLALHQMSLGHAEWISNFSLGYRLWGTAASFVTGETADIVGHGQGAALAIAPLALAVAAMGLLALRGSAAERGSAALPLAVGATTIGVPLAISFVLPDKDFVLARNLLPALVPLLVVVAIATTTGAARRLGTAIGAALIAYSLGFSVYASVSEDLHRPDWEEVAARLGEPEAPRATVTWTLGEASLRYYLSTGAIQVKASDPYDWLVHEVNFVSDGPAPPPPAEALGPGFREVAREDLGRLSIRRYRQTGPGLGPLLLRRVTRPDLGWRSNGVLLDGIGPG